ncbi:MAG: YeeE/YedE family protein, partial [Alphaproteobacteria bacterium]|nr:YeeE/YedE family protein [Alphaproteobacteria bacterium]
MSTARPTPAARASGIDVAPALVAATLLAALTAATAVTVGGRQAAILVVAAGLGVALYHGALGFTAMWRRWLATGDGTGVRVQLGIIGLGSLGVMPLVGGWLPGFSAYGAVAPLGLELVLGAALFGLGMQLANGCGSGTLFTLGGGSTKMLLTLAAFVAGSLAATFHLHLWRELPGLPAFSTVHAWGVPAALAAQAALLLVLARLARPSGAGAWSVHLAAAALAVLAVVLFWLQGFPWGVTFAFALWGGKLYEAVGGDLAAVPFWSAGWAQAALDESVLRNATSVTNFGVVLGALLAAALAGRFRPPRTVPWGSALAAVVGGLAMGYGARLAYGCNIGALLGGTMSGSLHGWVWLAAALAGMWL